MTPFCLFLTVSLTLLLSRPAWTKSTWSEGASFHHKWTWTPSRWLLAHEAPLRSTSDHNTPDWTPDRAGKANI
ncbi:hypothetical protein V8C34DRAFT_277184 [Trichoderma compactum]